MNQTLQVAVQWGIDNEQTAIQEYKQVHNVMYREGYLKSSAVLVWVGYR